MNWALFRDWLESLPWLQIIPILISALALLGVIISVYQSKEARKISKKANKLAEKAISESRKQFASLNKPLLVVEQLRFGNKQDYLEMAIEDKNTMLITTLISIENVGSIIAGNVFIHSSTGILDINDRRIGRDEQAYKPLNENDNLSTLHIPPKQTIAKAMKYQFQLPSETDGGTLKKEAVSLIQNILIYYYSDTKQTPNDLAKDKQYHTNVTHIICYNGYRTSIQMF